MKIKLNNSSEASPDEIALLETMLGRGLSPEFIEFVRKNDGSEPEVNVFEIDGENESGINGFIPICRIPEEMRQIENLPLGAFPFAWAEGGNYVLIDLSKGGSVFFWDHERPDALVRLGDSFHAFLEKVKPFDVSAIKLKPGQVSEVWVDPDFLKSLGG